MVGHRGWPTTEHGENTLASLDAALHAGADGVEVDVRLTRDQVAVCCHDSNLSRLAGVDVDLTDLTWAALRTIALPPGHRIARLVDVVDLVAQRGQLVLDLKMDNRPTALVEQTLAALPAGSCPDDLVVSSFHDPVLDELAGMRPQLSRARIVDDDEAVAPALAAALDRGDDALHLPVRTALDDPVALRSVLDAGRAVRAWTVNRPVDARLCEAIGVAAVITDRPADLLAATRPLVGTSPVR